MSKICQICGKGYQRGKLVPRGVGRRVLSRTTTRQQPNLRKKKFETSDGVMVNVKLCSSCLKRINKA